MLKIEHLKKHYDNFSLDCSLELMEKTGCQGFLSRKWKKESLVWKMIMYIIFPSNLGVIKVFEGMSF